MGVGYVAGYAKTQSGSGGIRTEAVVGLEDALELILRQTGALVHDEEDQHLFVIHQDDAHPVAVLDAVVHQVADATLEGQQLAAIGPLAVPLYGKQILVQVHGLRHLFQQGIDVDELEVLVNVGLFHRLQRPLHHQLQLVQILVELGYLGFVIEQLDPQPQPGDGGLEIVGDGAEQPLPVVYEAADALLHDVEGAGRRHYL